MRKLPDDEQVAKLQVAILRYLAEHPQATDAVRGIARFWIGAGGAPPARSPALDAVQRALDRLVATHRIACSVLADGTRVYAAARNGPPRAAGGAARKPGRGGT